MGYPKTPKAGEYSAVAQFVTMQELLAMTAYIREFKQKYAMKKLVTKKKTTRY